MLGFCHSTGLGGFAGPAMKGVNSIRAVGVLRPTRARPRRPRGKYGLDEIELTVNQAAIGRLSGFSIAGWEVDLGEAILNSRMARAGRGDEARRVDLVSRWVYAILFVALAGTTLT